MHKYVLTRTLFLTTLLAGVYFTPAPRVLWADEPAAAEQKTEGADKETAAGHSTHGEAFNEGPRQAAYLMEGMSNIQFDVSTSNAEAKKFFRQGVAQLHGFWYYEAERSFRQAAALDPNCAMTYWGMALANVNNRKRAEAFIAQAVTRREGASEREQMYIDAVQRRFRDKVDGKKPSKKETAETYTRDLESLVLKFPEDLEARAFLGLQLWENERNDLPLASHVAVNSVLQDVFDKNPLHPAHHYRIHLWDSRAPIQAVASAALCGPSLPGIAHMWHMPGHTYSNLQRFQDAVWQQEASARVDHAHMMRDRVMPDQIHNFAHNNEWMIRNLNKIGRVRDAVNLASNMIELPRHPKFNTLKSGSAKYGRQRLLETLSNYRLWDEMIAAIDSGHIQMGDAAETQIETLRHLGIAQAMLDRADDAAKTLADLESRLGIAEAELKSIADQDRPTPTAQRPDEGQPPAPQPPTTAAEPPKVAATPPAEDAAAETPAASAGDTAPSKAACNDEPADEAKKAEEASRAEEAKKKVEEAKKAAEEELKKVKAERDKRKKELEPQPKDLREAIAAIQAVSASRSGQWDKALELYDKAGGWDKLLKVEWLAKSYVPAAAAAVNKPDESAVAEKADKNAKDDKKDGKDTKEKKAPLSALEKAIELAEAEAKSNPSTVLPGAVNTFVRWQASGAKDAKAEFDKLRDLACVSDLDTPLLSRLKPLAIELGYDAVWNKPYQPKSDTGPRPDLDTLGPFRYGPYQAPTWEAKTRAGEVVSSTKYAGKPVIVIFYLGFGCLHCMEQLQEFSPAADKFRAEGIELIAISQESPELLAKGLDAYDKALNLPLLADDQLNTFKSFRCYDDFEKQPLHGIFLIDGQGRVLWQDISYEPFKDEEFLLGEAKRLLKLKSK